MTASKRKPAGRRKRPKKSRRARRRSPALRLLKWGVLSLLLGAVAALGVLVGGYLHYNRGLPDFHRLKDYQPPQVTRIHAADGTPIAEYFTERRTLIGREEMPDVLIQAVLSAEDADFYRHEGLDYMGMLRALYNSVRAGRITGSGSTITQQTVKNLLLTPAQTFARKAREIILARRLEAQLTKDEILGIYLNAVYFGHGRYGVEEAARYYWGKPARELTLAEAATLAGLLQSPERLSPRKHPERARERRAYVLREMVENGFITAAEAEEAADAPFDLADPPELPVVEAAWFADEVRRRVVEVVGHDRFVTGGLRIETTLELDEQRAALAALREGLAAIDARQRYAEKMQRLPKSRWDEWRARRRKALRGAPPPAGRVVPALVTRVADGALHVDLGVGEAEIGAGATKRFAGEDGALPWKPGTVLPVTVRGDGPRHPEVMRATLAVGPQGAVVVVEPRTRRVVAMVGGDDYAEQPFNRALQARRQPGSTFKPFVWGAALESRRYTPATRVLDAPEVWHLGTGRFWEPQNYSAKFEGPVPLRTALAHSINSVSLRLAQDVGIEKVHDFARRAGITSPLADNLTIALGSSEVSPLELANAYATIADEGRPGFPRLITAVITRDGDRVPGLGLSEDAPPPEPVIEPAVAWLLRSMLRSVVTDGSGRALADLPRPVAGKTGTTNEARDAWFAGLLPEAVMVAWVGFDDGRSLGRRESGGRAAAPIVEAYVRAAAAEGPDWPAPPEGVVAATIDPETGLLAREGGVQEWFLEGTEPREVAPAPGEVDAGNFFFEELSGPSVAPPSVDLAPLPPRLMPDGTAGLPAAGRPPLDPEDMPR